ncbi:conserved hypothetical protein [Xanthomonas citri pv. citri]|uniref:nucleotidyl transferase AbiEii/AbiGii toxin family protein n=1 Tax=Xanthomonas citri TaxID=346 RepID=UPI00052D10E7|nr:nucleotidyl transferase AbiEii/AbiGii toxin family protein [Xanthomonas citri]CEE84472.1 conserved hypothetical protein [Xanthomonas citri pv. citri]CEH59892.1 conserved hypothetical protein [Xanthomonas citri pv. citri]
MDPQLLEKAECYFGGGTAIALALDEYRESADVDFLCASQAGYRLLRNTITQHDLGGIFFKPVTLLREPRADRYGIRAMLEVDGQPVKFEIVSEGRIAIDGAMDPQFGVPTLSREDLFAEKLLANADRWADRSVMSRDLIDLAAMTLHWGPIPDAAWDKASDAYGDHLRQAYNSALERVSDRAYLKRCLDAMQVEQAFAQKLLQTLAPAREKGLDL